MLGCECVVLGWLAGWVTVSGVVLSVWGCWLASMSSVSGKVLPVWGISKIQASQVERVLAESRVGLWYVCDTVSDGIGGGCSWS